MRLSNTGLNRLFKLLFLTVFLVLSGFLTKGKSLNSSNDGIMHQLSNLVCDGNNDINETLRNELGCDKNYTFIPVSDEKDQMGINHSRYQQCFFTIPVENAILILSNVNGRQILVTGTFVNVNTIFPSKIMTKNEVFESFSNRNILTSVNQLSKNEEFIKCKWIADSISKKLILAYEFENGEEENFQSQKRTVDCENGNILSVINQTCFADVTGSAETAYYGYKQIPTNFNQNLYTLQTTTRGKGVETVNLNNYLNYTSTTAFIDQDNFWQQSVPSGERYATDAHYCAVQYYDFLSSRFNRNSIDNNGQKLISYLNYSNNLLNAFWNGSAVVYGSGNATSTPMTTLDIAGHEFTHGLIQKTANLNYSGQPGTINEAIADIFGATLEYTADPQNADWTIGEKSGNTIRSMADPKLYNQPDTYLGLNWYSGTGDNGGVHINSGFINKWFYLLAEGGQGSNDNGNVYHVSGIGIQDASGIVYHSLIAWLVPSSGFENFKNATLKSAADLFGSCSPQYLAVADSWFAVGLGQGLTEPLTLSASGNTTFCEGQSVILTATGLAGSTYIWSNNGNQVLSGAAMQLNVDQSGIWTVSENRCGTVLNSAPVMITVHNLPNVSTSNASMCQGEQILLSGFPAGGNFSVANPYIGNTTTFSYSFTDSNGCSSAATGNIIVHEIPVVQITPMNNIIPVNNDPVILSGNVAGIFSGIGVDNNIFNPSTAGIGGPYPVYLNFTNSTGCTSSDTILITVIKPCSIPSEELKIKSDKSKVTPGDTITFSLDVDADDFRINWEIPYGCHALTSLNQTIIRVIWFSIAGEIGVELSNTCNDKFNIGSSIKITTSETSSLMEIFPVPAHDLLTVKYNNPESAGEVALRITDMSGKQVMNFPSISSEEKLNISNLNPGCYFIEVLDGPKISRKKIMKY